MTWRAVYCESKRELLARDGLVEAGFRVFCPFEKVTRRIKLRGQNEFRVETVNVSVFPNYLFIDSDSVFAIESVRGVISLVCAGTNLLPIPDRVMERLFALADPHGCVGSKNSNKISSGFLGVVGSAFEFKGRLLGLIGHISSLARLDETGEVSAWVEMLGGEHEVQVSHQDVGQFIQAA
jgi:transcription antitermination factor NusG